MAGEDVARPREWSEKTRIEVYLTCDHYRAISILISMDFMNARASRNVSPKASTPPLKPAWLHVLLALGDGPMHGYQIRESVEARTDGACTLWPAMLYGSLRDLTEQGALEPLDGDDDPDDDQRRRYYRLTDFGRELLRAEVDRLQALVDAARKTEALGRA
jgi:DNA-binding PadR family transcriptional regulator